ncbi:pentapeptide repeat-containing protein [Streptomyces sp. NPDC018833]|uniref:pentapeptide repeat-containing protein n=1 Tax=Streptomyces sp. NPDC018833 TaxID=3365053 RepID=UPI00379124CC
MAPVSSPPAWPHCGQGTTAGDPVGCIGRSVDPYSACLAHLTDTQRDAYFASLNRGSDIDHRGTRLDTALLDRLHDAVREPSTGRPVFGAAQFESATFSDDTCFDSVTFTGIVSFESAAFGGVASFESVSFGGDALFAGVAFARDVWFDAAGFRGNVSFGAATVDGDAGFDEATFDRAAMVGPLVCAGQVTLAGTVFGGPVTIALAARRVVCRRTRWSSTAALEVRYATVDFAHAVFEYPLSISAAADPFLLPDGRGVDESALAQGSGPVVRISSLRGVDAAHLVLADVDLSRCLLTGTVHLDQLRLEGTCTFAEVPPRRRWRPVRFTARRTLAEEQHWRAAHRSPTRGWDVAVFGAGDARPASLAPVYRQLRKSFEDSKNEPGAADFYYGEMEMRRHDPGTPRAERGLLNVYWAVSGYGLRALRAMSWLGLTILATLLVMMLWGLPKDDPKPVSKGRVTGQEISLTNDTPKPVNPDSGYLDRLSSDRFERSLRVVVNSVIFRSSGQNLTTTGTYTEMLARLTEPVLLGLAVLAVRGRVKR